MKDILLKMERITSSSFGIPTLKGVDFSLMSGEVHALVGENGAGKSTLMRVLFGMCPYDAGAIYLDGDKRAFRSPAEAMAAGIGFVPQQPSLVPHLTVAENILLGRESEGSFRLLDKQAQKNCVQQILDGYGLEFSAATPVDRLPPDQRQIVQIVKAIRPDVRVLILDEATTALQEHQVLWLHELIRELRVKGTGIIYISHRLGELARVADRVTVLRDGRNVCTSTMREMTGDSLIRQMIGNDLKKHYVRDFHLPGEPFLEVQGLCSSGVLRDVSFYVRRGEILGVVGRGGSGRSLLTKCLFGLVGRDAGEIRMGDGSVRINSPQDAVAAHIALVPEQRSRQGLFGTGDAQFNVTFKAMDTFMDGIRLNSKKEKALFQHYVRQLGIKSVSPNQAVNTLSGGNQQKVVIAKWLATDPALLILDQPTQGMDVVSKSEIYRILDGLVEQGVAILMVPSDISEAVNICDRILVLCEGKVRACIGRGKYNQTQIAKMMTEGP